MLNQIEQHTLEPYKKPVTSHQSPRQTKELKATDQFERFVASEVRTQIDVIAPNDWLDHVKSGHEYKIVSLKLRS